MDRIIYLDTHVVVWLYAGDLSVFSSKVLTLLEACELVISPIILLELQYLKEIKRIKKKPQVIFETLQDSIGLTVSKNDYVSIVSEALKQHWTRDPFDTMIVAEASWMKAKLLTKDRSILKQYKKAVWPV